MPNEFDNCVYFHVIKCVPAHCDHTMRQMTLIVKSRSVTYYENANEIYVQFSYVLPSLNQAIHRSVTLSNSSVNRKTFQHLDNLHGFSAALHN